MTAFPLMIAMMFKITDLSAITSSALPSAEAFYQATGSKKVTTFMMSWTILIYFSKAPTDPLQKNGTVQY